MKIGKTVRQAGPKVQKRGHGAIHYAIISVGGAGHDSFKQTQHASHAVDAIQRRNEMHFGRAGIRETDVYTAGDKRSRQALCTIHWTLRIGAWLIISGSGW